MLEYLPSLETLAEWLLEHGSLALFIVMALGIIALPVPEETLMIVTGTLMGSGKLYIIPTIIAAYLGSICGITVSYILGRTLGTYFVHKYGCWVGMKQATLDKIHVWFDCYGKWALLIGYFVPGVRHFTGFTAGTSLLDFRLFVVFAYTGALVWVATFLSIGYFFGEYCVNHCRNFELNADNIVLLIIIFLAVAAIFFYYRKTRKI